MTATVIINPYARGVSGRPGIVANIEKLLLDAGLDPRMHTSANGREATALAKRAAQARHDCVIAVGGDGSVNHVVNGVANSETAVGIIPLGTANATARFMGIQPGNVQAAVRAIANHTRRRIDLGRLGGRYFINMAGIGLDAQVAADVAATRLSRLGLFGYIARFGLTVANCRPWQFQCEIDGRQIADRLWAVLICNSGTYTWRAGLTPGVDPTDGKLAFVLVKASGRPALLRLAGQIFLQRLSAEDCPQMRVIRGERMSVTTVPEAKWQVEGEVLGTTPVVCSVVPASLTVLIPAPP